MCALVFRAASFPQHSRQIPIRAPAVFSTCHMPGPSLKWLFKKFRFEGVSWDHATQNRNEWLFLVNTEILGFHKMQGIS